MAAVAIFSPGLAVLATVIQMMGQRGWKFAMVGISVAVNALFMFALIVVGYAGSDDESLIVDHRGDGNAAIPEGFSLRRQGPLYFAEPVFDELSSITLRSSICVVLHGCIVATFEFEDGLSTLTNVQVWDAQCRPRIDFDVRTGATIYSLFETHKDMDPEYSIRDEDGDGIPDRKINWATSESFKRSGPMSWENVTVRDSSGDDHRE